MTATGKALLLSSKMKVFDVGLRAAYSRWKVVSTRAANTKRRANVVLIHGDVAIVSGTRAVDVETRFLVDKAVSASNLIIDVVAVKLIAKDKTYVCKKAAGCKH